MEPVVGMIEASISEPDLPTLACLQNTPGVTKRCICSPATSFRVGIGEGKDLAVSGRLQVGQCRDGVDIWVPSLDKAEQTRY